jgi:hypothetical protein
MRNYIPCMAHVIKPVMGVFMCSLGVTDCTNSWENHEHDQQFGENESTDVGQSRRMRKKANTRINKVLVMRQGSAMLIEKVCISRHFESPETDLYRAANAWCNNYADTGSLK